MSILSLIVLALIGESVWETLKMLWQQGKVSVDRIGALVVGLLLSLGTGLDIMSMVGIPMKYSILGVILTGILISRGANFMHDILASINNIQTNSKLNVPKEIEPVNITNDMK